MADVISVLRSELSSLELQLAEDPRYQKIAKIRELLVMYAGPAQQSELGATPEHVRQHVGDGTKVERVRSELEKFIRAKGGVAHRKDMLDHLISLGIMGHERNPLPSLAAYLTEMKDVFISHGGGQWALRSANVTRPARVSNPNSMTTAVVNAAAAFLRQKGARANSTEITDAIMDSVGLTSPKRVDTVSSMLSHSPLFDNVRGEGYGLAEWSPESPRDDPEAPSSGELLGAPKPNGEAPMNLF